MESSPLWAIALLAIVAGPFIVAIVCGIKNRRSGAPEHEATLEAPAMVQVWKDNEDMRHWGQSR